MCRKSTSDVAPGRRMSNRIPVDRKTFCLCLQCVKMRELSLLRLFYLRAFAQLHSLYALAYCGHESPHVAPCAAVLHFLSFSSLFIYAQITKPHSNHANMLMTFCERTNFFDTWNYLSVCIHAYSDSWACSRDCAWCVCFVLWADFIRRTFVPHILSGKWQYRTDMCMCLVGGASMFPRSCATFTLITFVFRFRLFVCLFIFHKSQKTLHKKTIWQ